VCSVRPGAAEVVQLLRIEAGLTPQASHHFPTHHIWSRYPDCQHLEERRDGRVYFLNLLKLSQSSTALECGEVVFGGGPAQWR